MVDALLEIHSGNWDDDIAVTHTYSHLGNGPITVSGELRVETSFQAGRDIEVTSSGYGIVLLGGDGNKYRLQIDNEGNLRATVV
jgi:hypothetical protein